MANNPAAPFIVLAMVVFSVAIYAVAGPALLGPLGAQAKESAGSDGSGFSVSNGSVDRFASTAIVQIPTLIISTVGIWAILALLVLLAYVGAI